MTTFYRLALVSVLVSGVLNSESRFNRPVVKLADPKAYKTFKMDDNQFAVLQNGPISVTCITYRGTQFYYVEVAILNQQGAAVMLDADFVKFNKPGYTVLLANTLETAAEILSQNSGEFLATPAPPPTQSTTTYSGTANTIGNTTQLNGTATTTVDNSAAGWHALGQAIAVRSFYNAQNANQRFAKYLAAFAHERQDRIVLPGIANLYTFAFQQVKQKKAPFVISVRVGREVFEFRYKE